MYWKFLGELDSFTKHPILNLLLKSIRDELRGKSRNVAQSSIFKKKMLCIAQVWLLSQILQHSANIRELTFLHSLQFDMFGF